MNSDVKLVAFDLNRTLIHENTWEDLNLAVGVTAEEDAMFMKWYEEGIISYEEGQRLLERIYRERGKGKRDIMIKAIGKYTYRDGAKEVVEYLKKKGYEVVLISGSVDILVKKVAEELGINMWEAHNGFEFDEKGDFVKIVCDGDDADFKLSAIEKFCKLSNVTVGDVLCVGDGYNDRKMFEASGRGVTFEDSVIEKYAWKTIGNLRDLEGIV